MRIKNYGTFYKALRLMENLEFIIIIIINLPHIHLKTIQSSPISGQIP